MTPDCYRTVHSRVREPDNMHVLWEFTAFKNESQQAIISLKIDVFALAHTGTKRGAAGLFACKCVWRGQRSTVWSRLLKLRSLRCFLLLLIFCGIQWSPHFAQLSQTQQESAKLRRPRCLEQRDCQKKSERDGANTRNSPRSADCHKNSKKQLEQPIPIGGSTYMQAYAGFCALTFRLINVPFSLSMCGI
jgi:hypothetical protein